MPESAKTTDQPVRSSAQAVTSYLKEAAVVVRSLRALSTAREKDGLTDKGRMFVHRSRSSFRPTREPITI